MKKYTYDEIDDMSCSELENLINEDAQLPENEQMDEELLLYVLGRMEISGEYKKCFSDTKKARDNFLNFYHKTKSKKFSWIKNSKVMKTACAILAMLIFFGLGTVTAEAAKYGYGKSDIHWTDEYFEFEGIDAFVQGVYVAGDFDTLPVLQPYQDMLIRVNCLEDVMVTYLPGEYYLLQFVQGESHVLNFEFKLEMYNAQNPDERILLWFNVPVAVGDGYKYYKDPGRPEEYKTNGVTHYIMTCDGLWQALWTNGRIECCISGVESKEELIKMIDSIYARNIPEE